MCINEHSLEAARVCLSGNVQTHLGFVVFPFENLQVKDRKILTSGYPGIN